MSNVLVVPDVEVVGTLPPSGAPSPVEDLTLTPDQDGSPLGDLSWSHDGVDLDRFEVLRKPSGTTSWERVILATASSFGLFPNYTYRVVTAPDTEWVVRAMNVDGEVSE